MRIFNGLKYARNSSVINTVARVTDRGKAVDSSGINVLKEALGARGKYFTKAERMYVLARLDNQYQALTAKAGSVPEAAAIAQELNGLKNQVSSYSRQNNDSVVKRFRNGVVNVVDGISSGLSAIKAPSLAYTVPAMAGVAMAAIMVGGNAGCSDVSGADRAKNTNSISQVSALAPVQPKKAETKVYTAPVSDPALERSAEFIAKARTDLAEATAGMNKTFGELQRYNAERESQIKTGQEQNRQLAKRNNDLTARLDKTDGDLKRETRQLKEATGKLNKATEDYQKAQEKIFTYEGRFDDLTAKLNTMQAQMENLSRSNAVLGTSLQESRGQTKRLGAEKKRIQAEKGRLETTVNGYKAAERAEREHERTEAECEREYRAGLAKANVKTESPKTLARNVQKPSQNVPIRAPTVQEDYSECERDAAKADALDKMRSQYDARIAASAKKPKMTSFAELNRVPKPGEIRAVISGRTINYNRGDVIDLSKPSGPTISYSDNNVNTNSAPRVVRALPVGKDETNNYRIEVKAPGFGDKKKPTRFERKKAQDKFNGMDKNKSPAKKGFAGNVFEDLGKYRKSAARELSQDSMDSALNSAESLAAGFYKLGATVSLGYATPKNHPELREDDLSIKKPARALWASVVDAGRRFAGPANKIEQARAYGHTKEGKKRDIPVLTGVMRALQGIFNIGEEALNAGTIGLSKNVTVNAREAFGDFVNFGVNYGGMWVNGGRELLVDRLTPNAQQGANNVVDWGLVPLKFAGHVVRGKGISHHENLPESVGNEGYIGVSAEGLAELFMMFGSGFVGESSSSSSFVPGGSGFGGGISGGSGGAAVFGGGIVGAPGGRR